MNFRELIEATNGQIFSVKFKKRTTGEIREMVCRTGVTKHLTENPTREGVDAKKNNLIHVWDLQANGYRSISLEGIIEVKINGVVHKKNVSK